MENNVEKLLLPAELVIGNVTGLFEELRGWDRSSRVALDFARVEKFDSAGIALLNYIKKHFSAVDFDHVKPEFQQVLDKYLTDEKIQPRQEPVASAVERIEKIGDRFWRFKNRARIYLSLLADEIYYTFQYLLKRRGVYPGEILHQLYFMAYDSAPIVCFISFLVGITISVTSAQQLKLFGADIYIADLVGFGMIRELVPLMTGIILAGKIGAAITAEISSMKVMEEVDALKTMGLQPEKFLMVPRLVAITMAIPLLVALADFVGIFAGMLVARFFLGIVPRVFLDEMFLIVDAGDVLIGLGKTIVFGWVVVVSAGYKGFSVERGAREIGVVTTKSVVLSISLIIVMDCIFAMMLY